MNIICKPVFMGKTLIAFDSRLGHYHKASMPETFAGLKEAWIKTKRSSMFYMPNWVVPFASWEYKERGHDRWVYPD